MTEAEPGAARAERFPTPADHPDREVLEWGTFGHAVRDLARAVVTSGWVPDVVLAIARGGLIPAGAIAYALDTKAMGTMNVEFYSGVGETLPDPVVLPPAMDPTELSGQRVLVVDDVADSGRTLDLVLTLVAQHGGEARSAVIYTKPTSIVTPTYTWRETDRWILFPWSTLPPVTGGASTDA
ncbi:phosphoribosyltransferase [Litorihabitans aurantiacus]|uniref:Phosphoribosyltransferase n=1 Tax=Litorihabitans aurantiacus TaxID=1930061 RepID=A0AA38CUE5_9MICO|nr:phosphoribosyltransferase [Litorihabitans aurantiacus]GMA33281.1 phosphoribosyltransferase [Litorihabitans aurantiacus]